jgi:hypothetical protein
MQAAGHTFNHDEDAQHIAASTHPRTERAREILEHNGVLVNGAANRVRLPNSMHHGHGSRSYAGIDHITFRLEQVGTTGPPSPGKVDLMLSGREDEVASGTFGDS